MLSLLPFVLELLRRAVAGISIKVVRGCPVYQAAHFRHRCGRIDVGLFDNAAPRPGPRGIGGCLARVRRLDHGIMRDGQFSRNRGGTA